MTADRQPSYWPEAPGYEDPSVQYDSHSGTFIAEFSHESDVFLSHVFYRRAGGGRYQPLTSLDQRYSQEQLVLDCESPTVAYLEFERREEADGDEHAVVSYDLAVGEIAQRWRRDDLETPDGNYEGVGYLSECLQLCNERRLRCTAALFGARAFNPDTDEASYDIWTCDLDVKTGRLELLAEMESPFC